jgi:hypothetical protein
VWLFFPARGQKKWNTYGREVVQGGGRRNYHTSMRKETCQIRSCITEHALINERSLGGGGEDGPRASLYFSP